ncbi:MAG: stage V sporulation T C-terminal domain-containing protein [Bacilli bacterium]
MKATGVVRRIDDLGRVVIPKEIRKGLRIKDGENLEIFVDDKENIILKKHSLMKKISDLAGDFADSIHIFTDKNVIITDMDNIIAVTGELKKEYLNKPISESLFTSIKRRENIFEKHVKNISLVDDKLLDATYIISTIVANGDAIGLVIILSTGEVVDLVDDKIARITSKFLSKYLEE